MYVCNVAPQFIYDEVAGSVALCLCSRSAAKAMHTLVRDATGEPSRSISAQHAWQTLADTDLIGASI